MDLGIKGWRATISPSAPAVKCTCSERASYITGVSLNLDGGRLKGLW